MENSELKNDAQPGPGDLLRTARETLGISQREMADRLNWMPEYVGALEQNRFDVLRGTAFVRGYLRAYGKQVGVPEDTLMSAYEALRTNGEEFDEIPERIEAKVPQAQKKGAAIPAGAALVVLLVVLLWIWRGADDQSSAPATAAPVERSEIDTPLQAEFALEQKSSTQPDEIVSAQPRSYGSRDGNPIPVVGTEVEAETETQAEITAPLLEQGAAHETEAPSVSSLATNPVADATRGDSEAASTGAADTETANIEVADSEESMFDAGLVGEASGSLLRFHFGGDCWIEVRNGAEELIYADLRREGDVLNLTGLSPFNVLLGDANQVELEYDGEPFTIPRRPGRVTARFSVGEE